MSEQKWIPIESNPEVLNKFLSNIGVPNEWSIVDVIGLDEELLPFIGGPVLALIVLCPTDVFENSVDRNKQNNEEDLKNVWFIRQTIRGACGTIAMIHALANNSDRIKFKDDSSFKAFFEKSRDLSPIERAKLLESNEDICRAHYNSAIDGQTIVPGDDAPNGHYGAIVQRNGMLYELDGRSVINHGKTSDETFVSDAARVCRQYMAKDSNNLKFSVLALSYQD